MFCAYRFASLHTALSVLSSRALAENGHRIAKALSTASLRTWGWLSLLSYRPTKETPHSQENNGSLNSHHALDASLLNDHSSHDNWQPMFVALTDRDLLLYEATPWSIDGWTKPTARIPLLMTRYISTHTHSCCCSLLY